MTLWPLSLGALCLRAWSRLLGALRLALLLLSAFGLLPLLLLSPFRLLPLLALLLLSTLHLLALLLSALGGLRHWRAVRTRLRTLHVWTRRAVGTRLRTLNLRARGPFYCLVTPWHTI